MCVLNVSVTLSGLLYLQSLKQKLKRTNIKYRKNEDHSEPDGASMNTRVCAPCVCGHRLLTRGEDSASPPCPPGLSTFSSVVTFAPGTCDDCFLSL